MCSVYMYGIQYTRALASSTYTTIGILPFLSTNRIQSTQLGELQAADCGRETRLDVLDVEYVWITRYDSIEDEGCETAPEKE